MIKISKWDEEEVHSVKQKMKKRKKNRIKKGSSHFVDDDFKIQLGFSPY